MKYIPGFEFTAGTQIKFRSDSVLKNNRKKQLQKSFHEKFHSGGIYKLLYIKPTKDNITYQFLENLNGNKNIIDVVFLDIIEAENTIDKLSGII